MLNSCLIELWQDLKFVISMNFPKKSSLIILSNLFDCLLKLNIIIVTLFFLFSEIKDSFEYEVWSKILQDVTRDSSIDRIPSEIFQVRYCVLRVMLLLYVCLYILGSTLYRIHMINRLNFGRLFNMLVDGSQ